MCGVRSLTGAKDSIPDLELRGFGGCGCGQDSPGKLGTGDPWQRRLVLVFALDLEQVEKVCAGGVDFDEIVIWRGGEGGEVDDFQVERSLKYRMGSQQLWVGGRIY